MAINFNNYYGKISNSGSDERGKYSGGAAGDQTGKEWQIRTWYSRPWYCVIRITNQKARQLLAELSIQAANNPNIGYNQKRRDTYWIQLSKNGYRPSKIKTPCQADCSAGVIANTKAVGYLLNISALKDISATYTGNMRAAYKNSGACQIYTDKKYLSSYDYLVPGDILLKDDSHVCVNLGIGKYSGYKASKPTSQTTSTKSSISKAVKYEGIVTATSLNVRTWAGKENKEVYFSPLKKGTHVYICDKISASDNTPWYYIKYAGKYGFVSATYVEKIKNSTVKPSLSTTPKYVAQVIPNKTAVRTWAGDKYPTLKSISQIYHGGRVYVCDTIEDDNDAEWAYILINNKVRGFVIAKDLKKI